VISYSVVIPTLGRPCLGRCLDALSTAQGPAPREVVLVDDRPGGASQPNLDGPAEIPFQIVLSGGSGPATARNAGWRATATPWVVFLDDDVLVDSQWPAQLASDLSGLPERVGGVQGQISVPQPEDRRGTDWERCTAGLASARWITADMACRRAALAESGGFDERFPRAFREDADLALRLLGDGWELRRGQRQTVHPVRPATPWISLRAQAGNADDALMRVLHGRHWHERAGADRGRRPRHLVITAALLAAGTLAWARRPRAALMAAAAAVAGTAEFAAARIRPGPRTPGEVATMAATSLVIPELAAWHWLRGRLAAAGSRPWPRPARAVLFDRDGTLIKNVPYNGDPSLVEPLPGARAAVRLARELGLRVGMVTNQSGIAHGLLSRGEADAVNERVARLVGPFDTVQVCPHGPDGGCGCRKPAPGMVIAAAAVLGVAPHECAVIGDIGADILAARAAGARGVLVPAPATRPDEKGGVRVAPDLSTAVLMVAGRRAAPPLWAGPPS
jgi:HAD superfamily hydrolase (TIGR01662 family)